VGLVDSGDVYRRFEQTDGRLGRHQWLDSRSVAFMVERDPDAMSGHLQDRLWRRVLPIMDQRDLGACTAYAGTGALGTEPFFSKAGKAVLSADVNAYAVTLYGAATRVDAWSGTYPPDDTGSSGLAICKVLKQRGTIKGYRWASSAYGLLQLLQTGPVLLGMPWWTAYFEPDRSGFIDSGKWQASELAGGHEVEVVGCEIDHKDVNRSVLTVANSWGTSYGLGGFFKLRLSTYSKLDGVDLKQYVI
jgi:hypothetical protein